MRRISRHEGCWLDVRDDANFCLLGLQDLSANRKGEMVLKVETDLATVATHFKDLEHPAWSKSLPF